MNKRRQRTAAALMSVTLAAGLIAGCSKGEAPPAAQPSDSGGAPKEVNYPEKLTYWAGMGNAGSVLKSFNEMGAYKEMEKITGTKVEFQHPPSGQEADQFNLMLASGKLPDIIEYNWASVAKGPDNAIKEKRIIRLNELIEEHAPNLTKILNEHPEWKKLITTDEGNIYVFPFIRGHEELLTFHGPVIRKDWLDKVNLPVPKTIDDWEKALTAFRDQDPNGNGQKDEIPFLLTMGDINVGHAFIGAWGITTEFYQDNGTVKYGPIQPEYKEFLTLMNRWYKEGLIDKDYATTDSKLKDAKMTGDQLGSIVTYNGSGIGRYTSLMKDSKPDFTLIGTTYPVLKEGDKALGQMDFPFRGDGGAISATAKNPEELVKWMDFRYGEQGHMLFNFGVEGESYVMENGYPKYTDLIMNNPDKLPITQAMAKYFVASWSGPIIQDVRYQEQYLSLDVQKEAIKNWMDADHSKLLPPITRTADESSRYSSIMNDINTYKTEMIDKFIMGAEPLDRFDDFVNTLKGMGIEEAIKIQQAALERFNQR